MCQKGKGTLAGYRDVIDSTWFSRRDGSGNLLWITESQGGRAGGEGSSGRMMHIFFLSALFGPSAWVARLVEGARMRNVDLHVVFLPLSWLEGRDGSLFGSSVGAARSKYHRCCCPRPPSIDILCVGIPSHAQAEIRPPGDPERCRFGLRTCDPQADQRGTPQGKVYSWRGLTEGDSCVSHPRFFFRAGTILSMVELWAFKL